jgi:hypothetical protein
LSPSLSELAHARGFQCLHVNHLGKTGEKDWSLKRTILDGDWTFVTNNSVDFRGPSSSPGTQGEYADVALHAGLVCIDAPGGLNKERQHRLFSLILDEFEKYGDLTNQVLEVYLRENGNVELARYNLPRET